MGGAVIDYLLGIPVHDYDIFYTYKPCLVQPQLNLPISWKLTEANFNDPQWVADHQEQYLQGIDEFGNHPISIVHEFLVEGEHKVQLIGVNYDNPIKHLQNFDHSLTLASYNRKGMFVSRKVFESKDDHTVTYVSKNKSPDAVLKSLERAKKKIARLPLDGHAWELQGFVAKPQPIFKWVNDFEDALA